MTAVEFRANDSAYELKARAGETECEPAAAELARMRQLIHDLRNPVGSMSMAVEMLLGPLHEGLDAMPPEMARRVRGTLEAMSESVRQMRYLVSDLGGLAAGTHEVAPNTHLSQEDLAAASTRQAPVPAVLAPVERGLEAETPTPAKKVDPSTMVPAPVTRPRATKIELGDLLRRLEILTVTRSSLPSLLAVDAQPDLWVEANGPELLRALSNIVENGIEAAARAGDGPGPWTVDVRAYERDGEVRVEVHNQGEALPPHVVAYLEHDATSGMTAPTRPASSKKEGGLHGVGLSVVKRVADAYEGRITGRSAAGITVVCLALPATTAPSADETEADGHDDSQRPDVAATRRPVLAVI